MLQLATENLINADEESMVVCLVETIDSNNNKKYVSALFKQRKDWKTLDKCGDWHTIEK